MRQTISVCHDCHRAIHHLVPSQKELGRHFNTSDKLLQHPEIASFVAWVRHQK